MAKDKRYPHCPVVRGEGSRVVAHTPETTLSAGQSLVGSEDYERLFVQTMLTKCLQDLANTVVDAANLGGVLANDREIADPVWIVVTPGVRISGFP